MDPLGLASGIAGLLSLGITVCHGLLDYYASWKDADDNIARTFASLEALVKNLLVLRAVIQHDRLNHDMSLYIEECTASTQKGVYSLQKKLSKVQAVSSQGDWQDKAKASFRRALFPFKESTLAKLRETCNDMRDDLTLALNMVHIDVSATSLDKLDILGHQLGSLAINIDRLREISDLVAENIGNVNESTIKTSVAINSLVSQKNTDYILEVLRWLSPACDTRRIWRP